MKYLLIAITMLGSTAAMAGEQTRFYDSRGRTTGTASTDSQGTTTFRDAQGRTVGTATGNGGRR